MFDFGEEGTATGEVTAVEEPSLIEHTWVWDGVPDSVVRWELAADGADDPVAATWS
ncbi:hypothetical protein UQW22_07570 [Isoptericola halotolerans]|uniref:hypothetical protein n=1 Tax=Isoptericola halotolerans TaxID=300560 RepID=UPI00388CFF06